MPAICRGDLIDKDVSHCNVPSRNQRSDDVFVNGIGISRQGDHNNSHLKPGSPCPSHTAPITTGSITVFINSMGCGRVGDSITGCTSVASGSTNTFAGP